MQQSYYYEGVDQHGKKKRGQIAARSIEDANRRLTAKALYLLRIHGEDQIAIDAAVHEAKKSAGADASPSGLQKEIRLFVKLP